MVRFIIKASFIIILVLILCFTSEKIWAKNNVNFIISDESEVTGRFLASDYQKTSIELWHYSGGYWGYGPLDDQLQIKDSISPDNWAKPEDLANALISEGVKVNFTFPLPDFVKTHVTNGGDIDILLEKSTDGLYIDKLIETKGKNRPSYTYDDNNLYIQVFPKFNCTGDYRMYVSSLNKTIPTVDSNYGYNVYSLWQNGSTYGAAHGTDIYNYDQGELCYEFIQDNVGRLKPKQPADPEGSERISIDTDSFIRGNGPNDVRIGWNTFNNAGAVGLYFWYPITVKFYARGAGGQAVIKHFLTDGTPLLGHDRTERIVNGGEYTFQPANISGYRYIGYKAGRDNPPDSPSINSGAVFFNYDGSYNSMNINFYYERISLPPVTGDGMDSSASGVIRADDRGNEKYDVLQGIPVTEDLYANVLGKEYLYDHRFAEKGGRRDYQIRVGKKYILRWDEGEYDTSYCEGCEDTDGDGINDKCNGHTSWNSDWKEDTRIVTNTYTVSRNYSYWVIDSLNVYGISYAEVNNAVLPGGKIKLEPQNYKNPEVVIEHSLPESEHIVEPNISTVDITNGSQVETVNLDLGSEVINGGRRSTAPSIPDVDWQADAENAVDEIKVRNDLLIFNGQTVMDNSFEDGAAPRPGKIPDSGVIDQNVLYTRDLNIPQNVPNGKHSSSGTILYKKVAEVNSNANDEEVQPINNINEVTVHTPVVCYAEMTDDIAHNQKVVPDTTRKSLILGRVFTVTLPTEGRHNNIPGYGNRDFGKYTRSKQVRFPFDVYQGNDSKGTYIPAGTWHEIPVSNNGDINFYLPVWVDEGNYSVDFREIAVNSNDDSKTQDLYNGSLNNYTAARTIDVQVIGRLYGFKVTDITDYPLWESVFRAGKNTSQHTGKYFWVGPKDKDGVDMGSSRALNLPVAEGSHPGYKNVGALKTGYRFRFELETIGKYYEEYDCINIKPSFYFVNRDGRGRREVDLWYGEHFDGKDNHFVKIGSDRDKVNVKYAKLGDVYRNVPENEIQDTVNVLNRVNSDTSDDITQNTFANQDSKLGWFFNSVLSKPMRTFTGNNGGNPLPGGVSPDKVKKSVQHWYGEYYLPDELYVAPKDYDVIEYSRKHNGLDGKEAFWLKEGYVIVNFEIETVKNKEFTTPVLNYWKVPAGYCNMWSLEGFNYSRSDSNGANFNLQNGDVVFYYANKRSSQDYKEGGTH